MAQALAENIRNSETGTIASLTVVVWRHWFRKCFCNTLVKNAEECGEKGVGWNSIVEFIGPEKKGQHTTAKHKDHVKSGFQKSSHQHVEINVSPPTRILRKKNWPNGMWEYVNGSKLRGGSEC